MGNVAIVTDSNSGISQAEGKELGIYVIPMPFLVDGKLYYEKCAYINFDDNTRMNKLFDEDFDLDRIIQGLKIESGVNIEPENTLIILDEIQETPNALKALKYFYENVILLQQVPF